MKVRILFYAALAVTLLVAILIKVQFVKKERAKDIPSALAIFENEGKPVKLASISSGIRTKSIQYKNNMPYLFVADKNRAKLVSLTILEKTQDIAQIAPIKGISSYVVEGASLLKSGDKILIIK